MGGEGARTVGPNRKTNTSQSQELSVHLQPHSVGDAEVRLLEAWNKGGHRMFQEKGMPAPSPLPSDLVSGQISGIQSSEEGRRGPLGVWEQGQLAD